MNNRQFNVWMQKLKNRQLAAARWEARFDAWYEDVGETLGHAIGKNKEELKQMFYDLVGFGDDTLKEEAR